MGSDRAAWVIMFVGFFASTISQLIIKARMDAATGAAISYKSLLLSPMMWLAVALILVFVVCWYTALAKLQLSVMMAWSAVILPLTAVGGYMFLGEPLGIGKIASIGVIAAGVAMLAVF